MSLRILLADDAPAVRQGVKGLLEREGFQVVGEATDGREAVRLAQALCPDVAILDLSMPRLNGLDTAREIRQVCPWTHLILLTGSTEEHQIVSALRAGIQGYVVKAEAPEDLARAIGEVSRGRIFFSRYPWAPLLRASKRSWSSSETVSITIRTYGISCLIRLVASSPSISGIEMSIRMTSGINSLALLRASRPFAASPATWNSPCPASRLTSPLRKRA